MSNLSYINHHKNHSPHQKFILLNLYPVHFIIYMHHIVNACMMANIF